MFGKPRDLSATSQPSDFHQIWSRNVVRCPSMNPEGHFRKFYFIGHFPQNLTSKLGSNRHITQSRLQVTGCTAQRYCLLHVVVQGPASFRGRINISVRRTVAELRGVKFGQFSDFGLFSPYKTPKTYLPVTSRQLRGYIAE